MNYWLSAAALENEAKRRCLDAGYTLDFPAGRLTSFPANDRRPLWRAHYLPAVIREASDGGVKPLVWHVVAALLLFLPFIVAAAANSFWGTWR